jgi:hypothetical protein
MSILKITEFTTVHRDNDGSILFKTDEIALIKHGQINRPKGFDTFKTLEEKQKTKFMKLYNKYKFPVSIIRQAKHKVDADSNYSDSDDENECDGFEILEIMNRCYLGRTYTSLEEWFNTEFLDEDGSYFEEDDVEEHIKIGYRKTVEMFENEHNWDFFVDANGSVWIFSD